MKVHTNAFKEQIKEMGKELDSLITFDGMELGSEQLNSITPSFESSILKSAMKMLEIDSNVEIPKGSVVNYKFGVKVNGVYEYLDFGNYIVYSVEKQEDTMSYKVVCYDKMLNAMKDYVSLQNGTFPMTIRSYIKNLCLDCGLTFKNTEDEFANYDKVLTSDVYAGLDYTYRDIFDELSAVTGGTICLDKEDNVEIRYITDTLDTIDEEYLKDINVNFGEKYGPVNSIVLSRSGESDNVYLQDEESVATNGLTELKIIDNQIMNLNNRADYLPNILGKLNGLEYYTNDFSSTGITYYDICDKYNVKIGENTYPCVMFNDEIWVTQGLEENVFTEMPEETKTDYSKSDKDDRRINQAYIIVDKQNQQTNALLSQVEENSEKIVKFDATIEDIKSSVSTTETLVKDLENSIDLFSVDLSQYTLTIPTDSSKKPLETRNYDVNFYGYYKGKQVVPSVTVDNSNAGITTSTTSTYIRFSVDINNIIANLTNNYTLTFTYNSPDGVYKLTKNIVLTLSTQGKDGTSVNILGSYDSLEELKQAHPSGNIGDAYIVQGDMYVWSAEENDWVDVGNIQGPKGDKGDTGAQGPKGIQGEKGDKGDKGDDGYTPQKGIDYFDGKDGKDGTSERLFIRYSANSNGNPMTTTPQSDTAYMGTITTTAPTAPTSYTAYTWTKVLGNQGAQGIPGNAGANGLTPYVHIMYSQDGMAFTPEEKSDDGTVIYPLGKKPSAWMGQYVDYNKADSTDFNDYEWYKFTEDIDDTLNGMQDDINKNKTDINNNYQDLVEQLDKKANDDELVTIRNSVETLQTDLMAQTKVTEEIVANGVSKVTTTSGTFDKNGLTIEKSGAETKSIVNQLGVNVKDSSDNDALFAGYVDDAKAEDNEKLKAYKGQTVVYSNNMIVDNYLMIGTHSRLEDYEDGTGIFVIG